MGGPWQPLQDPLRATIPDARRLYEQGPMGYGPNVVQGFNPAQRQALAQGLQMSGQGTGQLQQAFRGVANLADGGNGVLEAYAQNGVSNPVNDDLYQLHYDTKGSTGGLDYLRNAAGGGFLKDNPYLEQQIQAATGSARDTLLPALEGRMSQNGRYDADLEAKGQGAIAGQLGNIASGMRMQAFESERGRQQQAGMALPGAENAFTQTKLGVNQAVSGDAYQRLAQQMQAIGQADSTRLQAAGAMGDIYGQQFAGVDRALDYGGMQQDQAERQAQEAQGRLRFGQNAGWDNLNRYLQTLQGVGQPTNPTTAGQYAIGQMGGPSGSQAAMGNALAIAGLGAMVMGDRRRTAELAALRGSAA